MSEMFTSDDLELLDDRGIAVSEAHGQVELLRRPPRRLTLDSPCTLERGIARLDDGEHESLNRIYEQAARQGRWIKFVPASGAASRMFALKDDDPQRLAQNLPDFAFCDALSEACEKAGNSLTELLERRQYDTIVDLLLNEPGLGYASKPKGLLDFHRYENATRTPFEEHLREAAACFSDEHGHCHAHFTVSDEHRALFDELLGHVARRLRDELNVEVDVTFSVQKPSTDTLALGDDDLPARDSQGALLLRPGGHGALLENLRDLDADLMFVKNIDNICHQRLHQATRTWIAALGGYLLQLQQQVHEHLRALDSESSEQSVSRAEQFAAERITGDDPVSEAGDLQGRQQRIRRLLERPIRVCGMVKNEGEPGGGPFWVRHRDGASSAQIVESAELDPDDQQQQAIFRQSTHFNPVFMALALRDHHNKPFDLKQFVDNDRFILANKVSEGKKVRVLERPGLWNGSMANWISLFVEVPKQVFSPVKTVFDLLRDEHQPQ